MNILILGAGAIGSVYGAKLSQQHDVTLIGGAAHVAAIQKDGLQMQGLESGTLRLPAAARVESIAPSTLILLTTKVNNNVAAVAPIVSGVSDAALREMPLHGNARGEWAGGAAIVAGLVACSVPRASIQEL